MHAACFTQVIERHCPEYTQVSGLDHPVDVAACLLSVFRDAHGKCMVSRDRPGPQDRGGEGWWWVGVGGGGGGGGLQFTTCVTKVAEESRQWLTLSGWPMPRVRKGTVPEPAESKNSLLYDIKHTHSSKNNCQCREACIILLLLCMGVVVVVVGGGGGSVHLYIIFSLINRCWSGRFNL